MIKMLKKLIREEEGQTMVEYGLVIAGIAVVGIVVMQLLGMGIQDVFMELTDKLKNIITDL
jgi:pilus assembly protein Flp/PilA